jgi:hypothetical protein
MGMNPPESAKSPEALTDEPEQTSSSGARFGLVLGIITFLMLVSFGTGDYCAAVGLRDPDTCWLLALGRFMFQHGVIPNTDPFSYTFALQNQPFVMYQWLAELAYYSLYKWFWLTGLLAANAFVLGVSFVGVPALLFRRLHTPIKTGAVLLVLMLLSTRTRFLVRPEVPSYALFVVWLYLILIWRQPKRVIGCSDASKLLSKRDLAFVVSLFFVMILWANFHITFIYGFLVLALLIGADLIENLLHRRPIRPAFVPVVIALLATGVASCINPQGPGLLAYVPTLLTSSSNQFVGEVQPTSWQDFGEPVYQKYMIPFAILFIASVLVLIYTTVKVEVARSAPQMQSKGLATFLSHQDWYSILIISFVFVSALSSRRAVAFAAILLLIQCVYMLGRLHEMKAPANGQPYPKGRLIDWKSMALLLGTGLTAASAAYLQTLREPPSLPMNSQLFTVPAYALEALSKYPQHGRLLNDAQYGDLLIWYLPEKIPVFIDTRFGMYGGKLSSDYFRMTNCLMGFKTVLNDYQFDWAFLPASSQLADYLRHDRPWKEIYNDKVAAIFRHNPAQ